MKIFDAHCDTIEKLSIPGNSLYESFGHCDLKRMENYQSFVQVFACCVYPEKMGMDAFLQADNMISVFLDQIAQNNSKILLCKNSDDVNRVFSQEKIGAILALEGGSPLNGNIENVDYFFNRGVRIITLTWNHRNELGVGAMTANDEGLTHFGKDVVCRMHELGMIVDVSHLSDQGFYDVCQMDSIPFIASHSNARAICNHPRNLSDDMIREIIGRKGMIGFNLYAPFLSEKQPASIDHVIQHLEHILSLGGENCIGFGCDFDGMDLLPSGINGVQDLDTLCNRLLQRNHSEEFIEKITFRNFISFLHNYTQYIKIV